MYNVLRLSFLIHQPQPFYGLDRRFSPCEFSRSTKMSAGCRCLVVLCDILDMLLGRITPACFMLLDIILLRDQNILTVAALWLSMFQAGRAYLFGELPSLF